MTEDSDSYPDNGEEVPLITHPLSQTYSALPAMDPNQTRTPRVSVRRGWGWGGWASKKICNQDCWCVKATSECDTLKVHADRQLTAVVLPVSLTCENADTLVVRWNAGRYKNQQTNQLILRRLQSDEMQGVVKINKRINEFTLHTSFYAILFLISILMQWFMPLLPGRNSILPILLISASFWQPPPSTSQEKNQIDKTKSTIHSDLQKHNYK